MFNDDLNINHWLEQWYLTYQNCFKNLKNNENVHFICYEKLCNSDKYWMSILKNLNITESYDFVFEESKNNVMSLKTDKDITKKALSLYEELSQFILFE